MARGHERPRKRAHGVEIRRPRRVALADGRVPIVTPIALGPLEDYRRALAAEIAVIKATPRQEGIDEIRIPGERAYGERARLTREGLEVDRRIHDALFALAEGQRGA